MSKSNLFESLMALSHLKKPSLQFGKEIHDLFDNRRKDLSNQLQTAQQDIDEWCKSLIDQIKQHAEEQKRLLYEEYRQQLDFLGTTRQDFIDTALVYQQNRERDQYNELLQQCQNLNFKLAAELSYYQCEVPFIQVTRKDQETAKEKLGVCRTEVRILQSTTTTDVDDDDDRLKNCPVCPMVFALNSSPIDRILHVQSHIDK